MNISLVGTGRMGRGLMKVLAPHVPNIMWSSRSRERVQQMITEAGCENVVAVTHEEALQADVILVALWYRDLLPWLELHRDSLHGKILVEICNPFNEAFDDLTLDWGTSAAEQIQRLVPETHVVSAFKNTYFQVFDQPIHNGRVCDNFVTSDHEEAKQTVIQLLQPLPFRTLDAGSLINNRTIERMTLLERELSIRYHHYPYVGLSLFP